MRTMNFDSHPVDYPTLLACTVLYILNWLYHLTGLQIIHFAESVTAVLSAILTAARFIDWLKKKFFTKTPYK